MVHIGHGAPVGRPHRPDFVIGPVGYDPELLGVAVGDQRWTGRVVPVRRHIHLVRVVHGMKRLWRGVGRVRFVTGIDQAEGLVVALAAAHPVGGVVHVEEGRMLGQRQQRRSDVGLTVVDGGIGFEPMLLAADPHADLLGQAQDLVLRAPVNVDVARA